VTRSDALSVVPRHVIAHAVRRGQVRTAFSGVLLSAELADSRLARLRAALLRAGPDAALSHLSALEVWGLPGPRCRDIHVTTGPGRRLRVAGLVSHRREGFVAGPPQAMVRRGLLVTALEQSLVDSWPLAADDAQRAPLLEAVGRRMTTPERVGAVLRTSAPQQSGRAALLALLGKLEAGCRSELELWGHDHVFNGAGLPRFERQVPMRIGRATIYLDLLHRPTATNFELDGAKWHGGYTQRERDVRRDATLATLGIQVVRFTHDRLVLEPAAVRREVLAILTRRGWVAT